MTSQRFLHCVASALVQRHLEVLVNEMAFGPRLAQVSEDVWDCWQSTNNETQRLQDLAQLVRLSSAEVDKQFPAIISALPRKLAIGEQQVLIHYLRGVPAVVRRYFRQVNDPSGVMVPTDFQLDRAAQLIDLLPERQTHFEVGQPVPGQHTWTLQELLDLDGLGEVWLATNPIMPAPACFRFCLDERWRDYLGESVATLRRILAAGRQPGMLHLEDVVLENQPPLLRYEYLPACSLTALIQAWHRQPETVKSETPARCIRDLAKALIYFHRLLPSLPHLGLRPACIWVQTSRGGYKFKIGDLGIGAAITKAQWLQQNHGFPGQPANSNQVAASGTWTLHYLPESFSWQTAAPNGDIFALGVIWYQMLTGALNTSVPSDWQHQLKTAPIQQAEALTQVLAACLANDSAQRLPDASALAHQLDLIFQPADQSSFAMLAPGSKLLTTKNLHSSGPSSATALTSDAHSHTALDINADADSHTALSAPSLTTADSVRPRAPSRWRRLITVISCCLLLGLLAVLSQNWIALSFSFSPNRPPEFLQMPASLEQIQAAQLACALRLREPVEKTNLLGMVLRLIPPGTFVMGSPTTEPGRRDNENQVTVVLTQPFYLSEYEVTQQQFQSLMGTNPSYFRAPGRDQHPVEQVDFETAQEFCRRLTIYEREQGILQSDWQYQLPTEAQWEYACRAGTTTRFHFGDLYSGLEAQLQGSGTQPVGSYPANRFGLFDMHGNVWEWCQDWYRTEHVGQLDPLGSDPGKDFQKVYRGGGWGSGPLSGRCAHRGYYSPTLQRANLGFRVALNPVSE